MRVDDENEIEVHREKGVIALPEVNLTQVFSVNQLVKASGLSNDFIEQECNKYQASNGKTGLPWFRRGSRKGIYVLSFTEFMHRLEKEVLIG